jgi:glycosyltransferase involved in cell wall biosynthesis
VYCSASDISSLRMLYLAQWSPDRSPSQRYRVEPFLDYWTAHGLETSYEWAIDSADQRAFYGRKLPAKAAVAMKAAIRRGTRLAFRLARSAPDVVLIQRQAFFLGGPWAEWIASRRAPLLFDFDDAIWLPEISRGNRRFASLKNVEKIPTILRMASTVIAGNSYLADWARPHNPNVLVIPTCVDTDRYVPRATARAPNAPVVIGWSGSPSTIVHFARALPVLARIKNKYGSRVRFKVVGDPEFRDHRLGIQGEAWSSDIEVAALQAMDIGIMPLPNDEWSRGKCGLKALTYMATGLPTLSSPVGVNTDIVSNGVNGYLPESDDEWVERLGQLIEDEGLRTRLGDAGRSTVVEHYSVRRWRQPLLEIIHRTATGQDPRHSSDPPSGTPPRRFGDDEWSGSASSSR